MRLRFLLGLACALFCLNLCGCGLFWEEKQREVESTGHGVLLFPTDKETRAGER